MVTMIVGYYVTMGASYYVTIVIGYYNYYYSSRKNGDLKII